jgi:hypothetical protein
MESSLLIKYLSIFSRWSSSPFTAEVVSPVFELRLHRRGDEIFTLRVFVCKNDVMFQVGHLYLLRIIALEYFASDTKCR